MALISRFPALLLLALTVGAYAWSIHGDFHFDDSHTIQNNQAVHSLKSLPTFWTDVSTSSEIPENRTYRPLTFSVFSIAWFIGNGQTWPFHLLKVILHFLFSWLVYLVASQLVSKIKPWSFQLISQKEFSFILASLVAIHPALSESVMYVSATSTQLSSVLLLASYFLFLRCLTNFHVWELALSLSLYFLSMMAKEEGICLVALVIVTLIYFDKKKWRLGIPYLAVALAGGFLIYLMQAPQAHLSRSMVGRLDYFMTQWGAYLHYMKLTLWPWELNADNTSFEFSKSFFEPRTLQGLVGNLLLLGLAWSARRTTPGILFGLLWFYITVSPASSIIPLSEPVNEHRQYLATVGILSAALWLLLQIQIPKRQFMAAWIVTLSALMVGTYFRSQVWLTSESLWADTVKKNPTSGRALNNLALVYMKRAQYTQAIDMLHRCELSWNAYVVCPINKGISLAAIGKTMEAEQSFQRALVLDPRHLHANLFYGKFLMNHRKDYSKAASYIQKGIEISSGRSQDAIDSLAQLKRFHLVSRIN